MNKEQAFQMVVGICGAFKNLNMNEAFQLREALLILEKELFPKVEEVKSEDKV